MRLHSATSGFLHWKESPDAHGKKDAVSFYSVLRISGCLCTVRYCSAVPFLLISAPNIYVYTLLFRLSPLHRIFLNYFLLVFKTFCDRSRTYCKTNVVEFFAQELTFLFDKNKMINYSFFLGLIQRFTKIFRQLLQKTFIDILYMLYKEF